MRRKFFLVLFITVMIGIQPVFAQSGSGAPAKPAAPGKPAKEAELVININLASDSEFAQALEAAGDVELVNEETAKTDEAKTQVSGKEPGQEK